MNNSTARNAVEMLAILDPDFLTSNESPSTPSPNVNPPNAPNVIPPNSPNVNPPNIN
jgi:hypothetical protein